MRIAYWLLMLLGLTLAGATFDLSVAAAAPLDFDAQLRPYITKNNANYSIYVEDLKTEEEWVLQDRPMRAASMIKLWIMAEAFHQAESGQLNLDAAVVITSAVKVGGSGMLQYLPDNTVRTWRELVELMITESDNTATNLLIDQLGFAAINQMADDLDCSRTSLQRKMMDAQAVQAGKENWTTVRDVGRFYELLYTKRCVSPEADEAMLNILLKQEDQDKIPAQLPAGYRVAHKTGELAGVIHDGGIVFFPQGDYIICIMTDEVQNPEQTIQDIAGLSKAVYLKLKGSTGK